MTRLCALACGAALLLFAGCSPSHTYYHPTERVRGQSLEGYRAAIYDLSRPSGKFGEVKVWSRGAYKNQADRTVIEVNVEIENGGHYPFSVDQHSLILDSVQTKKVVLSNLRPQYQSSQGPVSPGQVGTFRYYFILPLGISPKDVKAFRMRWTVAGDGQRYTEFTPFVQDQPQYAYAVVPVWGYWYPYLSPFYYPYYVPWGYGWGGFGLDIVDNGVHRIDLHPDEEGDPPSRAREHHTR